MIFWIFLFLLGKILESVLGLNVASKKSDVGKYFKKVQGAVEGIKRGLNKIVAEMKEEKNPNAAGVESEVKKLVSEALDKIIDGAKTVGEAIGTVGSDLLGNFASQGSGGVLGTEVEKLVKGIKDIVDIVLKEGKHDAGNDKKASDGSTSRTANGGTDEAGKLFGTTSNSGVGAAAGDAKKVATDASKAVGAVTGADILQAIVKSGDAAAAGAKDATVAGAIALRAIVKDGKFPGVTATAAADNLDYTAVVKGAAVSAVSKALDALTIAIRKTIDEGLKKVKEAIKINANDTPLASENSGSGAQNQ
ncbi:Variable outer membrane protein [Borrelia duttonii CR2A]|uniref:Variable large protein n=1 Tax=Borrelia duttonii CR2A TaxID=1432657 RepID=W6TFI7_9SPIR|nr:Variable outer membrane protein [Borrelia duttonii CR2A]